MSCLIRAFNSASMANCTCNSDGSIASDGACELEAAPKKPLEPAGGPGGGDLGTSNKRIEGDEGDAACDAAAPKKPLGAGDAAAPRKPPGGPSTCGAPRSTAPGGRWCGWEEVETEGG